MPRSLKIPAKSIKTRKYSPRSVLKCPTPVVSVCNAFKFPETEYPKAPSIYLKPCCTKYKATETLNNKSNAMCKCPKSSKIIDSIKRDKKKQTNTTTGLVESTKSAPLPYCFNGRFPEVEYPLNIVETWSPKYWTQLPNTQIKKCSTTICNQDTEDIIKTTHTAIEKAVHALLQSQQTSSLPADTCPLNEQAITQFLTSDQGNVALITNATTIPAVPQASDIQDSKQNTPKNNKAASINDSKSNGQDLAITDDLPDKTIIPSSGGSNTKNESDLPVIVTDPSSKLIPSGESILSNVSSNEAPVGTDPSSVTALSCPVIPSDNVESVSLAKDSLSTSNLIENISDSSISPAVPDLDYSAVGSGIPGKGDPSKGDTVILDNSIPKSNSVSSLSTLDEHSPHTADEATTETVTLSTLGFTAPTKSLNPEKEGNTQDSSPAAKPNNDKSILSEVNSSPPCPTVPTQEKSELPLESVVKETSGAPLSTPISPKMSTVPKINDSSIDTKTLTNDDTSLGSTMNAINPHSSSVHPVEDIPGGPSEGADATIPEITSTPPKSTIPDTSDSFDEPSILNKDDTPFDTTTNNTDDFPAISKGVINTSSNNICVSSATGENARKSSSLSDSSDDVQPNMMEIQEYDYTTVSPFYNDLEVDSFNNVPNKETWILDPDDKEYLIVGKLS